MAKAIKKKNRIEDVLVPIDEQPYEIPDNWCWIHLLDSFDNVTDSKRKLPTKEYLEDGDYPVVDQGQEFIGGYTNDEDMSYGGELPVIIFGDHTRCVKYIDFRFAQGADGVKVLKPKRYWDPKAFYYAIQSVEIPNMGYRRHFPLFKNYSIPVPPIPEQLRIVEQIESLFSRLDEAKEKIQEALDGFDNRRRTILDMAFEGKYSRGSNIDSVNSLIQGMQHVRDEMISNKIIQKAKVKPMRGDEYYEAFPANWKQVKLGEIAFVTKLAGFEYTKYFELKDEGEVPVIRAQNVRKGYLDTQNLLFIDNKISELLQRSALSKAAVLITFIGAGIGDVCIFDEERRFHLAPNVAKVEPYVDNREDFNIRYIMFYLLSDFGQQEIFKNMKATAQPSLSMETIRDIIIPIPDINEQNEIVEIIESLLEKENEAKDVAEGMIEQIDLIKKSVLAKAFRGKLGTNVPDEESVRVTLKKMIEE